MEFHDQQKEEFIAKYQKIRRERNDFQLDESEGLLGVPGGGFERITRERLLGIKGKTGRGRSEADFWCDVRKRVKAGLIDQELLITVASEKNLSQVLTRETIRPFLEALLIHPISLTRDPKHDSNRAEIAQMLIQMGFDYLTSKPDLMSLPHSRVVEDAIDLSKQLADSFRPEEKRGYLSPLRSKFGLTI